MTMNNIDNKVCGRKERKKNVVKHAVKSSLGKLCSEDVKDVNMGESESRWFIHVQHLYGIVQRVFYYIYDTRRASKC